MPGVFGWHSCCIESYVYICFMKRIVIFASGSGTNMQRIAEYFIDNDTVEISAVVCNKPDAGVIARAAKFSIPLLMIDRNSFYKTEELTKTLQNLHTDLIILAGFLWLIPNHLLQAFPNRMINIHPALLPKYGGKGMYGMKVHEAVINAREKKSGITIHLVNENYDEGQILFQQSIDLDPYETPQSLAGRIHQLEYEYFPVVINQYLESRC
jgi:phosphoribosylglycinamide formyltransferase 1